MPAFRAEAEALKQHEQIHEGLEGMEKYLQECRKGERGFKREELRGLMERWGGVLWKHMDAEVWELGAERMRAYWSLEEMKGMRL